MIKFLIKKPLDPLLNQENTKGFKKTLTGLDLSFLGIGAIIGAGLFVLTGKAAANFTGPGIVVSFFLAALI